MNVYLEFWKNYVKLELASLILVIPLFITRNLLFGMLSTVLCGPSLFKSLSLTSYSNASSKIGKLKLMGNFCIGETL